MTAKGGGGGLVDNHQEGAGPSWSAADLNTKNTLSIPSCVAAMSVREDDALFSRGADT